MIFWNKTATKITPRSEYPITLYPDDTLKIDITKTYDIKMKETKTFQNLEEAVSYAQWVNSL